MADKLLSGRRILVVEDDMLIRLTLEDMLTELGCESASAAATVDQAIGMIETQAFDVAILDVNLRGATSYPVADILTEFGVPYVFSTGYGEHFVRDGYRDRPILKKPFLYEQLAEIFARLLS